MIVVVGSPVAAPDGTSFSPVGLAAQTAIDIAARGERVELIGRVGRDDAGDAIVLALGRAGVGHAALLRDAARSTPIGDAVDGIPFDGGDLQLALRYLTAFDAAIAMTERHIAHVCLVESGRLCGVVSERDLFSLQIDASGNSVWNTDERGHCSLLNFAP